MIRFALMGTAAFATFFPSTALAQDSSPRWLPLGTVQVGATIEASFMVFATAPDPDTIPFKIKPPKFVKLVKAFVTRTPALEGVALSVVIAIDTRRPDDLDGEIQVTLGPKTTKVPVTAVVKPADPKSLRLLVAGSPFHVFASIDGGDFKTWTDLVAVAHWNVDYLSVDKEKPVFRDLDLGKYGTVLLPAHGLVFATENDIQRAREFVRRGGHLVLMASADFGGSIDAANKILDGSGLKMQDADAPGLMREVVFDKEMFAPEIAKAGIGSLRFFRASPIAVQGAEKARVLVKAAWVGGPEDGFVATARVREGQFVVLGISSWRPWICPDGAQGADNARLLRYLLTPGGASQPPLGPIATEHKPRAIPASASFLANA